MNARCDALAASVARQVPLALFSPVKHPLTHSRYRETEEHADCAIFCGTYQFKVHEVAIGAHSKYFRTALKANTFQICECCHLE
jgi:hypothetical protein